jgi:hypothetical protein
LIIRTQSGLSRVLLFAMLLLFPFRTWADGRLSLEAESGLGYNSNIYLDASAIPAELETRGGMFISAAPLSQGILGKRSGHYLLLKYGGDLRHYFLSQEGASETLLDHKLTLGYGSPSLAGFHVRVTSSLAQLYLRELKEGGWLGLWSALEVQRPLGYSCEISLGYFPEYTSFPSGNAIRWQMGHRFKLGFTWRLVRDLLLEPAYSFSMTQADPREAESIEHEGSLRIHWSFPILPMDAALEYSLKLLELQGTLSRTNPVGKPLPDTSVERNDLIHQVLVETTYKVTPWLELALRADWIVGRSNLEADYGRYQVWSGAMLAWDYSYPRTDAISRNLQLQVHAPQAHRVALVGSFNGWDPSHDPLTARGDSWEIDVSLPAGRHHYMIWVDGQLQPPPDCAQWTSDGFGGQSCVIWIAP